MYLGHDIGRRKWQRALPGVVLLTGDQLLGTQQLLAVGASADLIDDHGTGRVRVGAGLGDTSAHGVDSICFVVSSTESVAERVQPVLLTTQNDENQLGFKNYERKLL